MDINNGWIIEAESNLHCAPKLGMKTKPASRAKGFIIHTQAEFETTEISHARFNKNMFISCCRHILTQDVGTLGKGACSLAVTHWLIPLTVDLILTAPQKEKGKSVGCYSLLKHVWALSLHSEMSRKSGYKSRKLQQSAMGICRDIDLGRHFMMPYPDLWFQSGWACHRDGLYSSLSWPCLFIHVTTSIHNIITSCYDRLYSLSLANIASWSI